MTSLDNIKAMVKGCYDLQELRLQCGLRLVANFRSKLTQHKDKEVDSEEEGKKILDELRASYRMLTLGVAQNRRLLSRKGFIGNELINEFPEAVLVDQFMRLEYEEGVQFRYLGELLEDIPIYTSYLVHQRGIGPAMAGVLVSKFDPHEALHVSSFWKFAGLDVGPDGRGRSRRKEHLVERTYIDKKGKQQTKMGITYDPWVKTKLVGVLAGSFLRSGSEWTKSYYDYKHRLETDPTRQKATVDEWKKLNDKGEPVNHLWTPGRINNASKRYMVKMFLIEFWVKWRTLEGLSVTPTYHEAQREYEHGGEPIANTG